MNRELKLCIWTLLLFFITGLSSAFAADEVRLKYAIFTPYYENGFDSAELEGAVEVANLGPQKEVFIHYQSESGEWLDHPAFYEGLGTDNYEVFRFRLPLVGAVSSVTFAIKYRVNDRTYWDNNDQHDFHFDGTQQAIFAHQSVVLDDAIRGFSQASMKARSKYHNENDRVTLVYTLDGWQHQLEQPMELSHINGGGKNLNAVWQVTTPAFEYFRTVEFYLRYESDIETSFDNNNKHDYRLLDTSGPIGMGTKLQRYQNVFFRGQPWNWSSRGMSLIDDYTWSISIYFDGYTDFKFDIYDDWSRNFGDNNNDGIVDRNGANMKVPTAGTIRIDFNDLTGEYKILPYY